MTLMRPRDREVLDMKYSEGLSDAEIGERLGIKKETAKKRAHDARARCRALLEENGVDFDDKEGGAAP